MVRCVAELFHVDEFFIAAVLTVFNCTVYYRGRHQFRLLVFQLYRWLMIVAPLPFYFVSQVP